MRIALMGLMLAAAVGARAQSPAPTGGADALRQLLRQSRHDDLQAVIKNSVTEMANDALESESCRPFASVTALSDRAKAVQSYLSKRAAPESATKTARVMAARDRAERLGGLVPGSLPGGLVCSLESGVDFEP